MWPFKSKDWDKLGTTWTVTALQAQLVAKLAPEYISLRDNDFRALPQKDFEQLVFDNWFPHDEPAYKAEVFDCDDFAICFMAALAVAWARKTKRPEALAFGYISARLDAGQHAFIWHMDDNGTVRFYEPQTGKLADYKPLSVRAVES